MTKLLDAAQERLMQVREDNEYESPKVACTR